MNGAGSGRAERCDGQSLLAAFEAATATLERHAEAINALNVFPVPDGDTGKNMLLTMQAALESIRAAGSGPQATPPVTGASALATRLARGAMLGSRGNSGVILSQILRGFARGLGETERFDGQALAAALREATTTAYRAVQQPVEGTMLTVIRETAEAAEQAAARDAGVIHVLDEALAAARVSLQRTPELLSRLREAGVVDAGGQGLVSLLDGAARYAHGQSLDQTTAPTGEAVATRGEQFADFMELHEDDAVGYCTNLLILPREAETLPFDTVRERLLALGTSGVVIGDETLLKIHIHTEDPGAILVEAARWGEMSQIRIDNMSLQVRDVAEEVQAITGRGGATAVAERPAADARQLGPRPPAEEVSGPQIVAVASGEGLVEVLRALGAAGIVSGGQTMNPSTEELLAAAEALPGDEVILLPNNKNVILAAEQVVDLSAKRVVVVPTKSVPQGIAALSAVNFDADLDKNAATMTEAASGIRSGEVTRAVRSATIDGVTVTEGQVIGLVDGKLCCAGENVETVLRELLNQADASGAELITLYRGADVDEATGRAMVESLAARYPDAEFELVAGGQAHYDYLLSVE